jgi:hypothetical protein
MALLEKYEFEGSARPRASVHSRGRDAAAKSRARRDETPKDISAGGTEHGENLRIVLDSRCVLYIIKWLYKQPQAYRRLDSTLTFTQPGELFSLGWLGKSHGANWLTRSK